jgi:hypothetical protein
LAGCGGVAAKREQMQGENGLLSPGNSQNYFLSISLDIHQQITYKLPHLG